MFKIPIPFLFKAPFDKQTLENVFLGLEYEEDESSVFDYEDNDDDEESSRSSNSSSEETDSRFMDEKGTSFIALHPHQRVSVVNPSFLPKHILNKGHNDDISQISLDFGDVSSIESSVRLNPYGASSEQMEIAMRWRQNIAAAQKHDSECLKAYSEATKKPMIQKEKKYETARSHSSSTIAGNTRLVTSGCSQDTTSFKDTFSKSDCYSRQLHDTSYSSPPPPPPPPLPKPKKKFSESQFQISPPPIRSKSIGDSYKRLRRLRDEESSNIDSFYRSTSMENHMPRNTKKNQSISNLDCMNQLKIKISSQHERRNQEQKKEIDQTLPISDSDDDSLDHVFRVEKVKRRSDVFKNLFEPFDDNVSIVGVSLTYSDSVLGSLQTDEGKKDECIVIYEDDLQEMERAAVIIQSTYRGWSSRYRILCDFGVAKRRHWQIREKSHSITKIHSSIRRDARKLLRIQSTSSMIVAVRIVCAERIQRWWRNASVALTHRRETGFDISLVPKDWYENMKLTDVGIPFFKDDFEAIVGISTSKFTKTASRRCVTDSDEAFVFDTEYYQQANQNMYEDDAADDVLEVHENSQFVASVSLLPKIFNGIVGRFVKIFRKNKQQKYQEGKKIQKKEKRAIQFFKRSKRKSNRNPSSDDLHSETLLPDPLSMYESLEDETPGVASTASFESVPFDEI